MKKIILLACLFSSLSYGEGTREPEDLKKLRHGIRVEGCVAGLMYYTRDLVVSKAMRDYCESVISDVYFMYDFRHKHKIDPKENNFKRDEIKI
ncbi:hypothetical protein N9948_02080 [bacterium]|nr:hypothetical protein [bacterium]